MIKRKGLNEERGTIIDVYKHPVTSDGKYVRNETGIIIQPDDKEYTISETGENRDYSQFVVGQRVVHVSTEDDSATFDELAYDQGLVDIVERGTIIDVSKYPVMRDGKVIRNDAGIVIQPDDKKYTISTMISDEEYSQFVVGQRVAYVTLPYIYYHATYDEYTYDQERQSTKGPVM